MADVWNCNENPAVRDEVVAGMQSVRQAGREGRVCDSQHFGPRGRRSPSREI